VLVLSIQSKVRIEKDFLGEKELPIHAYYGIQTLRASEKDYVLNIKQYLK
jgi:aspartate ammonia-lyase